MTSIAWFVRGQKHAKLAEVSIAAVRKISKALIPVVATDDPAVTVPGALMVRFEPGLPLMVANIEAQLAVMWERRTPVWFIDTDVLLLKTPPDIWGQQLVVTWRDNVGGKLRDSDKQGVAEMMPYNYGVMGVLPGPRTIEAFIWMRERVRRMAPALRDWYGNQMALANLAGAPPVAGTSIEERHIPWMLHEPSSSLVVRKIPGEVWNYTVASEDEDVSGRGALHFKGHSRPLMKHYATRLGLVWPFAEDAA